MAGLQGWVMLVYRGSSPPRQLAEIDRTDPLVLMKKLLRPIILALLIAATAATVATVPASAQPYSLTVRLADGSPAVGRGRPPCRCHARAGRHSRGVARHAGVARGPSWTRSRRPRMASTDDPRSEEDGGRGAAASAGSPGGRSADRTRATGSCRRRTRRRPRSRPPNGPVAEPASTPEDTPQPPTEARTSQLLRRAHGSSQAAPRPLGARDREGQRAERRCRGFARALADRGRAPEAPQR